MLVTLAGRFENAVLRAVTDHYPSGVLGGDFEYDLNLLRPTPAHYFERCATFIAISDEILFPEADWARDPDMPYLVAPLEDFGITRAGHRDAYWNYDLAVFLEFALRKEAFDKRASDILRDIGPKRDTWPGRTRLQIDPPYGFCGVSMEGKPVDTFSFQFLMRLMLQVQQSRAIRSTLVISIDDLEILKQLGDFVLKHKLPTPVDLPEIEESRVVDGDSFAGGLLNFAPPDALAAAAVRRDPVVKTYAAKVRRFLEKDSTFETQQGLVRAMRAAMAASDKIDNETRVFEVVNWTTRPLEFIPIVGHFVTGGKTVVDLFEKWRLRKRSSDKWFLIAARMTDVSLRDYLRRKSNL